MPKLAKNRYQCFLCWLDQNQFAMLKLTLNGHQNKAMLKRTHCENQWYIYKYIWPNQIMLGLTRFMNIDIFCTDLTKTRSSSNSLWIINGNISSFGLTKTRLCWLNRVVWQMKMKKYIHETICKALFSRPLKFFLADYLSKVIHAFWKWSCSLESNECKRLSDE